MTETNTPQQDQRQPITEGVLWSVLELRIRTYEKQLELKVDGEYHLNKDARLNITKELNKTCEMLNMLTGGYADLAENQVALIMQQIEAAKLEAKMRDEEDKKPKSDIILPESSKPGAKIIQLNK